MSVRRVSSLLPVAIAFVVVVGSSALADPGDVDTNFGTLGHTSVDLAGLDRIHGVDRQSTGRIVLAGDNTSNAVQVFRLMPGGDPDAGFGTGGSTTLPIPGASAVVAEDLAIQQNDRILVAAWMDAVSGKDRFVLARFRPGGAPDASFGVGGIKKVGFTQGDAYSYGVAVQSDGRIVLVGEVAVSANVTRIAVIRLRSGGALDTSFGTGGRKIVPLPDDFAGFDGAWRVRVMSDGRLVLAGWNQIDTLPGGYRTVAVRLQPNGRFDRSFSGDGIALINVRPSVNDWAYGLELDGGKVVLGVAGLQSEAAVVRLNANGSRDTTFSGDGIAKFFVSGFSVSDVAVQTDGKILLSDSGLGQLLRVRPGGSRDLGFGSSGVTSDPDGPEEADAIELQGAKILLAGIAADASAVSRFLGS